MMFGDNVLRIQHDHGFGIEFNATDALKCVNNCQGMIKVACAAEWQESRYSNFITSGQVLVCYIWNCHTVVKGTNWTLDHIAFGCTLDTACNHRSHFSLLSSSFLLKWASYIFQLCHIFLEVNVKFNDLILFLFIQTHRASSIRRLYCVVLQSAVRVQNLSLRNKAEQSPCMRTNYDA